MVAPFAVTVCVSRVPTTSASTTQRTVIAPAGFGWVISSIRPVSSAVTSSGGAVRACNGPKARCVRPYAPVTPRRSGPSSRAWATAGCHCDQRVMSATTAQMSFGGSAMTVLVVRVQGMSGVWHDGATTHRPSCYSPG